MIASINGNTCPILTFCGFTEGPETSAFFYKRMGGQSSDVITSEITVEVGLLFIDVKLEKY